MFDFRVRDESLDALRHQMFDLVIVGGGINGAGVARDAASRGMKVALIDQQDFAAGTSSRSSKLIHGGIRYLENLELRLVFEALTERRLLFEIAPHLVHPLRFILPVYNSSRVGMFKMGLGMWLYDALALFEAPQLHERMSVSEVVEKLPWLEAQHLLGAFAYSDAYMDDDRLVIETMRSAKKMGAHCVSYVRVESASIQDRRVRRLTVKDLHSDKIFEICGRHFVSCVGPWTDLFGGQILSPWKKRLRPTKGIHLTFSRERFPLEDAVVMALEKEDRIVFGIPRHEMVIVGTTDTDFLSDPSAVTVTPADVQYLLKVVNDSFPGAQLTQKDILASYAGVRPLVADDSSTTSKTSREHTIFTDPHGVTFVAGGKYTTYRHMAEQTLDECLKFFSLEDRVKFGRTTTKRPINPLTSPEMLERARVQREAWSKDYCVSLAKVDLAIERHGFEALEILNRMVRWRPSSPDEDTGYWMAEADFAIDETLCLNVCDFYLRRSPLFLARRDHGLSLLNAIAKVFGEKLGWNATAVASESALFEDHVRHEMAWTQTL